MNKAIKAKWLEALKSGKYRKGRHELKQTRNKKSQYCCLGVLCELYRQEKGEGRWTRDMRGNFYFRGQRGVLPIEVMAWAELPVQQGIEGIEYSNEDDHNLASLNDKTKGFSAVIKAIETKL